MKLKSLTVVLCSKVNNNICKFSYPSMPWLILQCQGMPSDATECPAMTCVTHWCHAMPQPALLCHSPWWCHNPSCKTMADDMLDYINVLSCTFGHIADVSMVWQCSVHPLWLSFAAVLMLLLHIPHNVQSPCKTHYLAEKLKHEKTVEEEKLLLLEEVWSVSELKIVG